MASSTQVEDVVALMRKVAELKEQNSQMLEALKELVGALNWCGGSADFHPGGTAEKGWQAVVQPALKLGDAALASAQQEGHGDG